MKAIAAMLRGLQEETLKDDVGALQLEKGRWPTEPSKYYVIKNKRQASNKCRSHLHAWSRSSDKK